MAVSIDEIKAGPIVNGTSKAGALNVLTDVKAGPIVDSTIVTIAANIDGTLKVST